MISIVQTDLISTTMVTKFLLPLNLQVQQGDATAILISWSGTATIASIADTDNNVYVAGPTVSNGSGGTQLNVAVYYCISLSVNTAPFVIATITFSAQATRINAAFLDLNGATFQIQLDQSANGSASFDGGAETLTPNIPITISSPYEVLIAIVGLSSATSATPNTGWIQIPGKMTVGVFYRTMGSVTGSYTASPCTLGSMIRSAMAIIGLGTTLVVQAGNIIAPRFPDTFSPRLADYFYDSLQNDPTFVADPYGPRPFTWTS